MSATWETENVTLWLGNDEGLYLAARELAQRHGSVGSRIAEGFARRVMPDGTPDMSSAAEYARVDWQEVAEYIDDCNAD